MLNDTPTSAMTVLRLAIKGQKVSGGPIPGNPCPFPKIVGITQPIKTNHPHSLGPLSPSEMVHLLSMECVSPRALSPSDTAHALSMECVSPWINLLSLYFWLALEFFPVRSQGPSLGGLSQGLARDLGCDHSLVPSSPAMVEWEVAKKQGPLSYNCTELNSATTMWTWKRILSSRWEHSMA